MSPNALKSIVQPEPPLPFLRRVRAYRLLLILSGLVLVLDQITKFWIQHRLPFGTFGPPDAIEIILGFFNLVHVGNTGAAWSILTGRSVMLAAMAALTMVAIFAWRRALGLRQKLTQISFGLLCGGIVGNLIDRIVWGHVIDFLDFHFGSYIFPTFNVADSGICVGVTLYLIQSLRQQH